MAKYGPRQKPLTRKCPVCGSLNHGKHPITRAGQFISGVASQKPRRVQKPRPPRKLPRKPRKWAVITPKDDDDYPLKTERRDLKGRRWKPRKKKS